MNPESEVAQVIRFAMTYQGQEWSVSSIYGYRYKDTGEHLWSLNLIRHRWDGVGDRYIRLMVTCVDGKFQARQAEMQKWNSIRYSDIWKNKG